MPSPAATVQRITDSWAGVQREENEGIGGGIREQSPPRREGNSLRSMTQPITEQRSRPHCPQGAVRAALREPDTAVATGARRVEHAHAPTPPGDLGTMLAPSHLPGRAAGLSSTSTTPLGASPWPTSAVTWLAGSCCLDGAKTEESEASASAAPTDPSLAGDTNVVTDAAVPGSGALAEA